MGRKVSIGVFTVLATVMVVSFQNCGAEGQRSLFEKTSAVTFPYKTSADQIAYMSCAEQNNINNEPGVFFTFRAGAYTSLAGLGLTDEFKYETRRMDPEEIMDELALDEKSVNSRLQFALRRQNSLSQMFVSSSGGQADGLDFDYFFGTIGSDEMSASLLTMPEEQNYLNYWAAGGINPDARFQGTLQFNISEVLANQVRQFLTSEGLLALTFADAVNPATIRDPFYSADEDDAASLASNAAYGSGFKVSFRQPDPSLWAHSTAATPHFNMPKRSLASITEIDLSVPNKAVGNWQCPAAYQLMIFHPEDTDLAGTPPPGVDCVPGPDSTAPADVEILKVIRRSLPKSDWYVDLVNRCVIPKKFVSGSCYGIVSGTSTTRPVEYDFTKACDPSINTVCPHIVSICIKTL